MHKRDTYRAVCGAVRVGVDAPMDARACGDLITPQWRRAVGGSGNWPALIAHAGWRRVLDSSFDQSHIRNGRGPVLQLLIVVGAFLA